VIVFSQTLFQSVNQVSTKATNQGRHEVIARGKGSYDAAMQEIRVV
jgi:hypothetical protein